MGGTHSGTEKKKEKVQHSHTEGTHVAKPRNLTSLLDEQMNNGDSKRTTLLLCDLDLRDCDIPQVCAVLRDDTNIKELDLANNLLTDTVIEECLLDTLLHNTTICSLRVAGNHFSGVGVRTLRAFLSCRAALLSARKKGLQAVELRALGINAACGILLRDFLTSYQNVTSLNLHENPLKADGIKVLCEGLIRNRSIKSLVLYGSEMGPWGAFHLAKALPLTGITKLNLYKSHLEDNGATIIADVLTKSPNLRSLLLGYNGIRCEGACALGKALAHNETLIELDMYSNNIGDTGVIAIAQALRANKSMRFLLLAKNRFSRAAVKEMAECVTENFYVQAIDLGIDSRLRDLCGSDLTSIQSHLDDNRISYEQRKRLRRHNKSFMRRSSSSSGLLSHQSSSEGSDVCDSPFQELKSGYRGSMQLPQGVMRMLQEEARANVQGNSGIPSTARPVHRVLGARVRAESEQPHLSPVMKKHIALRREANGLLIRTVSDPDVNQSQSFSPPMQLMSPLRNFQQGQTKHGSFTSLPPFSPVSRSKTESGE